jgi:hypothetical protein
MQVRGVWPAGKHALVISNNLLLDISFNSPCSQPESGGGAGCGTASRTVNVDGPRGLQRLAVELSAVTPDGVSEYAEQHGAMVGTVHDAASASCVAQLWSPT